MAINWKEKKKKLKKAVTKSLTSVRFSVFSPESLSDDEKRELLNSDGKLRIVDKNKFRWGGLEDKTKYNKYDIIPFVVTQEWYARTRRAYQKKQIGLGIGDVDYKIEYPVHFLGDNGRHICLQEWFGEPCSTCEERERLIENKEYEDPEGKKADDLKPKWRTLYNIVNLDGDGDVELFDISYHKFEKLIRKELRGNEDGLEFFWDLDKEDGKTIYWRGSQGKWENNTFIEPDRISFMPRDDDYSQDILEAVYPLDKLFYIPTYEEIARIINDVPDMSNDNSSNDSYQDKKKNKFQKKTIESSQRPVGRSRFAKSKEKKEEKQNNEVCEHGHVIGVDFDQHIECANCDPAVYDVCQEKNMEQHSQVDVDQDDDPPWEEDGNSMVEKIESAQEKEPDDIPEQQGVRRSSSRRRRAS
jgi:hypothetical protein